MTNPIAMTNPFALTNPIALMNPILPNYHAMRLRYFNLHARIPFVHANIQNNIRLTNELINCRVEHQLDRESRAVEVLALCLEVNVESFLS
jgi:hypothetical protein